MTELSIADTYRSPVGNPRFEIERGTPSPDVLEERLRFVLAMNWFSPEEHLQDNDRYDEHLGTYHLTKRTEDGAISATMRLTRVESVQDSLSYEMLAENQEFQSMVAANGDGLAEGRVWDLTRLCHPSLRSDNIQEITEAMVELFGMGEYVSMAGAERDEAVHWIFTTTPWMMKFFKVHGIEVTELGRGMLKNADGTPENTLFCMVDVRGAVASLEQNIQHYLTHRLLQRGIEEARQADAYS